MTQKKKKKNINLGLLIRVTFFFLLPLSVSAETIEKKYASFKLLNKTTNKVSSKDILVSSKTSWETLNIEMEPHKKTYKIKKTDEINSMLEEHMTTLAS